MTNSSTIEGGHTKDPEFDQEGRTVERVAEARLPTEMGEFRLLGYRSLISDEEFVVLARGVIKPERPTLARIHSQCLTGDVFGSVKCDCGQQLKKAMKMIAAENCGVIVYQQQEGQRHRDHQQDTSLSIAGCWCRYHRSKRKARSTCGPQALRTVCRDTRRPGATARSADLQQS